MILIIVSAILGVCMAIAFDLYIPPSLSTYAAIVIIAAIDALMEGYKSLLRDKFSSLIFVGAFFGNSVLAALMVFFGKKIDLDLYYAIVIVFTMRIFSNVSFVRRYYIKKLSKKLKKC